MAVGHKEIALNTLHEVLTAKRHRTWQQVMEEITLQYVELCVELQKGKMAKDGLIQYRMSCQVTSAAPLYCKRPAPFFWAVGPSTPLPSEITRFPPLRSMST